MPSDLKSFDIRVPSTEDDIFEECSTTWPYYKKFLFREIYDVVVKLEEYTVMSITIEVICELAEVCWRA